MKFREYPIIMELSEDFCNSQRINFYHGNNNRFLPVSIPHIKSDKGLKQHVMKIHVRNRSSMKSKILNGILTLVLSVSLFYIALCYSPNTIFRALSSGNSTRRLAEGRDDYNLHCVRSQRDGNQGNEQGAGVSDAGWSGSQNLDKYKDIKYIGRMINSPIADRQERSLYSLIRLLLHNDLEPFARNAVLELERLKSIIPRGITQNIYINYASSIQTYTDKISTSCSKYLSDMRYLKIRLKCIRSKPREAKHTAYLPCFKFNRDELKIPSLAGTDHVYRISEQLERVCHSLKIFFEKSLTQTRLLHLTAIAGKDVRGLMTSRAAQEALCSTVKLAGSYEELTADLISMFIEVRNLSEDIKRKRYSAIIMQIPTVPDGETDAQAMDMAIPVTPIPTEGPDGSIFQADPAPATSPVPGPSSSPVGRYQGMLQADGNEANQHFMSVNAEAFDDIFSNLSHMSDERIGMHINSMLDETMKLQIGSGPDEYMTSQCISNMKWIAKSDIKQYLDRFISYLELLRQYIQSCEDVGNLERNQVKDIRQLKTLLSNKIWQPNSPANVAFETVCESAANKLQQNIIVEMSNIFHAVPLYPLAQGEPRLDDSSLDFKQKVRALANNLTEAAVSLISRLQMLNDMILQVDIMSSHVKNAEMSSLLLNFVQETLIPLEGQISTMSLSLGELVFEAITSYPINGGPWQTEVLVAGQPHEVLALAVPGEGPTPSPSQRATFAAGQHQPMDTEPASSQHPSAPFEFESMLEQRIEDLQRSGIPLGVNRTFFELFSEDFLLPEQSPVLPLQPLATAPITYDDQQPSTSQHTVQQQVIRVDAEEEGHGSQRRRHMSVDEGLFNSKRRKE